MFAQCSTPLLATFRTFTSCTSHQQVCRQKYRASSIQRTKKDFIELLDRVHILHMEHHLPLVGRLPPLLRRLHLHLQPCWQVIAVAIVIAIMIAISIAIAKPLAF